MYNLLSNSNDDDDDNVCNNFDSIGKVQEMSRTGCRNWTPKYGTRWSIE